jgi:hypothetical protein
MVMMKKVFKNFQKRNKEKTMLDIKKHNIERRKQVDVPQDKVPDTKLYLRNDKFEEDIFTIMDANYAKGTLKYHDYATRVYVNWFNNNVKNEKNKMNAFPVTEKKIIQKIMIIIMLEQFQKN